MDRIRIILLHFHSFANICVQRSSWKICRWLQRNNRQSWRFRFVKKTHQPTCLLPLRWSSFLVMLTFFASRLVQPWSRECEKYQREMGRNTIGRIVNKYKVRRTIIQTLEKTKINMKSIILQIYRLLEILRRLPSIYLNCSVEHHLSSLLNIKNDNRSRSMNFTNYNILFSISA